MTTVISAETIPAVLTQIVQRQDEQDARLEALTALCADQAEQLEQYEQQARLQAQALRATTTQLARNITSAGNGASAGRSEPSRGNGNGSDGGNANPSRANGKATRDSGNANPSRGNGKPRLVAGSEQGGDDPANAKARSAAGERGNGSRQKPAVADPPKEPEPAPRKKAHRWT